MIKKNYFPDIRKFTYICTVQCCLMYRLLRRRQYRKSQNKRTVRLFFQNVQTCALILACAFIFPKRPNMCVYFSMCAYFSMCVYFVIYGNLHPGNRPIIANQLEIRNGFFANSLCTDDDEQIQKSCQH